MVSLIVAVLVIVALWKVFTKAGEAGWKCLIPIYNAYIMFKIAKNENFAKYLVITIISSLAGSIGGGCLGYGAVSGNGTVIVVGTIAILVMIALLIWALIIGFGMYADLAKAFGHEKAFAWGLLLLSPIFLCILAFENSTYIYGETVADTTAAPFVEADNTTADPFVEADNMTADVYDEADKSSEDTE